jgi:hypothetical protein
MRRLYREEHADFTVKHFPEELRRHHGYLLGHTVTRLALQSASLVTPARRRGKHDGSASAGRCREHCCSQDGSTHSFRRLR